MIYADVLGAPLARGTRSPTSTRTEVRSPTSTRTEVRSPTSTSTEAYTQGNFTSTVTGGAGSGATNVSIYAAPLPPEKKHEQLGAPMYQATMHRLAFNFDRARQALVFQGQLENGYTFEVAFPIGHVALTFDTQASELGYCGAPIMGDVETVDGFLGAVEIMHQRETGVELGWFGSKLVKKVSHAVKSVATKAYKATVQKVAKQAVNYARKGAAVAGKVGVAIARSKLVGQALAGTALVFPAVGAPALAAWGAANRAVAIYDSARSGVKSAQQAVKTIQRNAQALTSSNAPHARMALAGLKAFAA